MTQSRKRWSPVLVCAVITTLLALTLLIYVRSPYGRLRMILGAHTLALLSRTDAVQAYRIDPNWVQNPGSETIGGNRLAEMGVDFKGFIITARGRPLDRNAVRALTSILRDARTYQGSRKDCDFAPTVAYRLRAGAESLELLLDFTCGRLQLLTRDARGAATHVVYGDFDRDLPALTALTRQTLPTKDPAGDQDKSQKRKQ
jgi:hypothetical protein